MKLKCLVFEYGKVPSKYREFVPKTESYKVAVIIVGYGFDKKETLIDNFVLSDAEYSDDRIGKLVKCIQGYHEEINHLTSAEYQLEVIKSVFNK